MSLMKVEYILIKQSGSNLGIFEQPPEKVKQEFLR
jgi:hypothetical protein